MKYGQLKIFFHLSKIDFKLLIFYWKCIGSDYSEFKVIGSFFLSFV